MSEEGEDYAQICFSDDDLGCVWMSPRMGRTGNLVNLSLVNGGNEQEPLKMGQTLHQSSAPTQQERDDHRKLHGYGLLLTSTGKDKMSFYLVNRTLC